MNEPSLPGRKAQPVQVSESSAEVAPFIYFDAILTAGFVHGNIRLELGASAVVPTQGGQTKTVQVITAHLRCSPSSAVALRKAIDDALLLLRRQRDRRARQGELPAL
jgi:hypothetical protein